eukprot:gene20056-22794_t
MFGKFFPSALFLAVVVLTHAAATSKYPPVQYTTQLLAFHGDQTNYDINSTVGLRWAGHLGIRYAHSAEDIYGFMPASPPSMPLYHLIDVLLNGTSFQGNVSRDNHRFEESFLSPHGFTVVFYDVPLEKCRTPDCGYIHLQQDLLASPLAHKAYAFPPSAPREYRNHDYSACDTTWGQSCFNCGTYTTSLGIEAVEETGMFHTYIPALAAQPTSHCRCFVSGEWVHNVFCGRDRWPTCQYHDPLPVLDSREAAILTDAMIDSVEKEEL